MNQQLETAVSGPEPSSIRFACVDGQLILQFQDANQSVSTKKSTKIFQGSASMKEKSKFNQYTHTQTYTHTHTHTSSVQQSPGALDTSKFIHQL